MPSGCASAATSRASASAHQPAAGLGGLGRRQLGPLRARLQDTTGGLNRDGDVVMRAAGPCHVAHRQATRRLGPRPRHRAVRGPARVQRIAEHQGPGGDRHRRHGRCGQRRDHPGRGSGRVRVCPASAFPSCARRSCRATNPPSSRCPATKAGRSGARSPTSPAQARPTSTSRSTWRWARSSSARLRRDGDLRQYGAVPAKGARLRLREYRTGGGRRDGVAARSLTVLKASMRSSRGWRSQASPRRCGRRGRRERQVQVGRWCGRARR